MNVIFIIAILANKNMCLSDWDSNTDPLLLNKARGTIFSHANFQLFNDFKKRDLNCFARLYRQDF